MKATRRIYGSRLKVSIGVIDSLPSFTFDVPSSEKLDDFYINMRSRDTGLITHLGLYGEVLEPAEEKKEETPAEEIVPEGIEEKNDLQVYIIVVNSYINGWNEEFTVNRILNYKSYNPQYAKARASFIKNIINAFLGRTNTLPKNTKSKIRKILNKETVKFYGDSKMTGGTIFKTLKVINNTSLRNKVLWTHSLSPEEKKERAEKLDLNELDNYEFIVYQRHNKIGKFTIVDQLSETKRSPSKRNAGSLVNNVFNVIDCFNDSYRGPAQKTWEAVQWFLGRRNIPEPHQGISGIVSKTYRSMKSMGLTQHIKFIK